MCLRNKTESITKSHYKKLLLKIKGYKAKFSQLAYKKDNICMNLMDTEKAFNRVPRYKI